MLSPDDWRVPWAALGAATVPRLFLGDRAFLRRYGSRLNEADIHGIMMHAWERGGLGLAAGDEASARAAGRLRHSHGASVLLHTPNLIALDGGDDPRRMAGLLRGLVGPLLATQRLDRDRIVGEFLRMSAPAGLSKEEVGALIRINRDSLEEVHGTIKIASPHVVTYGGDWLDLCMLTGRFDIIRAVTQSLRHALPPSCALAAFSYLGPCLANTREEMAALDFEGLLLPTNLLADGMMPSREEALQWARGQRMPICGVHVLALGRIPVSPALDYVFNHEGLDCALVGCGSIVHVDELIESARMVISDPA